VKATLEPVPDTPDLEPKVKLTVQVEEVELEPAPRPGRRSPKR